MNRLYAIDRARAAPAPWPIIAFPSPKADRIHGYRVGTGARAALAGARPAPLRDLLTAGAGIPSLGRTIARDLLEPPRARS